MVQSGSCGLLSMVLHGSVLVACHCMLLCSSVCCVSIMAHCMVQFGSLWFTVVWCGLLEGAEDGDTLSRSQSASLGKDCEELVGDYIMMMSFHFVQGPSVCPVLWLQVHVTRELEPPELQGRGTVGKSDTLGKRLAHKEQHFLVI